MRALWQCNSSHDGLRQRGCGAASRPTTARGLTSVGVMDGARDASPDACRRQHAVPAWYVYEKLA
jgi:hypothetical protein